MKPLILVVEDNKTILEEIKLILEFNGFESETAGDGEEGIAKLANMHKLPDLIISDIMMPRMDGYKFFKAVSENPSWYEIPFFFLTARASPDDIRLGKVLGVDDYLIKPFKEEDLLASINGKLARRAKIQAIASKMESMTNSIDIENKIPKKKVTSQDVYLIWAEWDEIIGPIIRECYPTEQNASFSINELAVQLYQASVPVYGYSSYDEDQDLLLNIKNINNMGYLYFGAIYDETVRGNQRQFMLIVISPEITYFESLKMKKILSVIGSAIKSNTKWQIEEYWTKILNILTD